MNINGGNGKDVIKGSALKDKIYGKGGGDKLYGLGGDDILYGGTGNDKIYGGDGNDTLFSGSGLDYLYGNDGNDHFHDIINSYSYGGLGDDHFFFWDNITKDNGYQIYYDSNDTPNWSNDIWSLENNFNPDLSSYDELVIEVYGEGGDDYFEAYDELLTSWAINHGKFFFDGGSGNDLAYIHGAGAGPLVLSGNANSVLLDGGKGFDTLVSPCFHHLDAGDPYLDHYGSSFDHIFNSSKNFDHFVTHAATSGTTCTLNIKDEVISNNKDFKITIIENNSPFYIDCSAESGANISFYVDNTYTMEHDGELEISFNWEKWGLDVDTHIVGGAGNDAFYGKGVGDSTFQGNGGNDYFDGDDGKNTVVFRGKFKQYKISEVGWNTFEIVDKVSGRDGTDTVFNTTKLKFLDQKISVPQTGIHIVGGKIKDVINGGKLSDKIEGRDGDDKLRGLSGNDTIYGGSGNDWITGDKGDDTLWGNKGRDVFKASMKKNGLDTIKDFEKGQDKILIGSLKKIKAKKKNGSLSIFSGGKQIFELEDFNGKLKKKGKFLL